MAAASMLHATRRRTPPLSAALATAFFASKPQPPPLVSPRLVDAAVSRCPSDALALSFFLWCARRPAYFHPPASFDRILPAATSAPSAAPSGPTPSCSCSGSTGAGASTRSCSSCSTKCLSGASTPASSPSTSPSTSTSGQAVSTPHCASYRNGTSRRPTTSPTPSSPLIFPEPGIGQRTVDDGELSPACMADAFRCLGKTARAALCAIARHLRLRTDVFNHLLDDTPLPENEVSSSELLVAYSNEQLPSGQAHIGCLRSSLAEADRGFVMLIASDHPGIEVCDANGHRYLADAGSCPSDLLLLTGRALSHVTAGLRATSQYRNTNGNRSELWTAGRASLTFRLMPRANAILDCSPISAAGHCILQIYEPVSASQFMDD